MALYQSFGVSLDVGMGPLRRNSENSARPSATKLWLTEKAGSTLAQLVQEHSIT